MTRDTEDVLRKARETLDAAKLGHADLVGAVPERRITGLHNVAVFGRSVSLVLQTLKSVDEERFNRWYAPHQAEMSGDPLFRYFTALRNEILKEGPPGAAVSLNIGYLNISDLMRLPRPPGASSFFVGDQFGGSGWMVPMPDGTTEKFYVELPPEVDVQVSFKLGDPPSEHLGQPIEDPTASELCDLYLNYLSSLVDSAEEEFSR